MPPAFLELSVVLVLATALGLVARYLKQPLILAYIFSGIIISSIGFFGKLEGEVLELLSNLGIAFLLFLVGLELKISDLKVVGKAAILTGIGQIAFTAGIGFVLISALGFSFVESIYIAVALTFSSTVIIIKLLSEKNDLQSLYGKIAVGFLLVQDFVAILFLMVLSGFSAEQVPSIMGILWVLVKGAVLVGISYLASRFFLKYLFRSTSTSTELLFVAAISWAFLFSVVAAKFGFSIAIGAFLAGIAIGASQYRIQISARLKPLRDFFIIIFFILLGASMSVGVSEVSIWHIIILSAFILIGNPLIVFAIMLTLGYRNRTSFLASVTVAQISEFSLILIAVGLSLGHVNSQTVSLVAAVGIVTITLSSYLILYGDKIYKIFSGPFSKIFPEKARDPYVVHRENLKNHAVLIGGEQMGSDILKFLDKKFENKEHIVVVDFNPEIVKELKAGGYNAVFGDISDPEVLEELELGKAKIIIITDPDVGDNSHLIKFAKEKNYKGPIISTSYWMHEAVKIYEMGADYVAVPELISGKHIEKVLEENWNSLSDIKKAKSKHFEDLLSKKLF
jgi:Kef-type K+ transport system membrane component KefB